MIKKIDLLKVLDRFLKTFDTRLIAGFERLVANTSKDFVASRSSSHLLLLLTTQFFLQNKNESSFFVRLFQKNTHLCLMITFPTSESKYVIGKDPLLKIIQRLVPATHEIEGSCFRWFHPELPYMCLYFEIQKLRGRESSSKEVRLLRQALEEQLAYFTPLYTPALFWPFNEEDAYKQIQILQKQLHHVDDLPQATIYFQKQSECKLEFLINLTRPQSDVSINQAAKKLPSSVSFFHHFSQKIECPFPLEAWCFSLTISSQPFYENDAINLLYARRHIAKYIELLVGSFRDYNGGLLEKQQEKFESLKMRLAKTIPDFPRFAEKVLYTLQPVEARLSLSFDEAERLLKTFSRIIKENGNQILRHSEGVLIVKTAHFSTLLPLIHKIKEWEKAVAYAQLSLSEFHYLCVLDRKNIYLSQLEALLRQPVQSHQKPSKLRLAFQAGKPPSLNPHYIFKDMRCRTLSKLLFEGLTRIDAYGVPRLAAAEKMNRSQDGLVYTFKLRPFCWSNGEKVTACHFINSWCSILQNPNFTNCSEYLFVIKNAQKFMKNQCSIEKLGIRAHGAETLEIQLKQPDPTFLHQLAQPMFFPSIGITQEPRWFNGPYLIQQQSSKGMLLESNPYYWDYQYLFFKQIQIKWLSDIESANHLFQDGIIDWIGDPVCKLTSEMVTHLQKERKLQQSSLARVCVAYINMQCSLLASAKIRHALSLAIDRSLAVKRIIPYSIPLYKPLPLSLSLCSNTLSDNNFVQSNLLFEEGLKEIKLSKENFPPLTLSYPHIASFKPLAEYLKETWEEALGISIHLEGAEWNIFRHSIEKGKFHIGMCEMGALYPDSSELLERFESIQKTNISQWEHPFYQEKLQLAKTIPHKRTQFLGEAEELLLEELPFIPICNLTLLFAHSPKLKGYVFDHAGCVDFRWAYLER